MDAAPVAPSPHWALPFAVAGAGVEVWGAGGVLRETLLQRFGAAARAPKEPCLLIRTGPNPAAVLDPNPGLRAEGPGWSAAIDLPRRRAIVSGEALADGVEAALRLAFPYLLADGLLVHAALLEVGGEGVLGVGPSGAGKTTLARLCAPHARGDELAVVRHDGNRWLAEAFPTPGSRRGALPLARLLLLRHAPTHELAPLPPGRAAGQLATQVHWPTGDRAAGGRTFATLARLAGEVPCLTLGFAPHPSVWQFLAGGDG